MNILKNFRKPYLSMFLASIVLFVSCEQANLNNDAESEFDYSVYNEFISGNSYSKANSFLSKSGNSNTIADAQKLLDDINLEYGTNIVFPNEFLGLTDYSPQHIETTALSKGWLNQNDIYLIDEFESDLKKSDFDTAIQNYENNVINLGLSGNELEEKNLAANAFKAFNNYHPELFDNTTYSKGGWGCFRAAAALTLSSVALASCATVLACGLAVTAWILSYSAYTDNCLKK